MSIFLVPVTVCAPHRERIPLPWFALVLLPDIPSLTHPWPACLYYLTQGQILMNIKERWQIQTRGQIDLTSSSSILPKCKPCSRPFLEMFRFHFVKNIYMLSFEQNMWHGVILVPNTLKLLLKLFVSNGLSVARFGVRPQLTPWSQSVKFFSPGAVCPTTGQSTVTFSVGVVRDCRMAAFLSSFGRVHVVLLVAEN